MYQGIFPGCPPRHFPPCRVSRSAGPVLWCGEVRPFQPGFLFLSTPSGWPFFFFRNRAFDGLVRVCGEDALIVMRLVHRLFLAVDPRTAISSLGGIKSSRASACVRIGRVGNSVYPDDPRSLRGKTQLQCICICIKCSMFMRCQFLGCPVPSWAVDDVVMLHGRSKTSRTTIGGNSSDVVASRWLFDSDWVNVHNLRGDYLRTQIGWVCGHQSCRIWRWELPGWGGSEAGSRRGPCMAVLGIKEGSGEVSVGR